MIYSIFFPIFSFCSIILIYFAFVIDSLQKTLFLRLTKYWSSLLKTNYEIEGKKLCSLLLLFRNSKSRASLQILQKQNVGCSASLMWPEVNTTFTKCSSQRDAGFECGTYQLLSFFTNFPAVRAAACFNANSLSFLLMFRSNLNPHFAFSR